MPNVMIFLTVKQCTTNHNPIKQKGKEIACPQRDKELSTVTTLCACHTPISALVLLVLPGLEYSSIDIGSNRL